MGDTDAWQEEVLPQCILAATMAEGPLGHALGLIPSMATGLTTSTTDDVSLELNTTTTGGQLDVTLGLNGSEQGHFLFAHSLMATEGALEAFSVEPFGGDLLFTLEATGQINCQSGPRAFDAGDFHQLGQYAYADNGRRMVEFMSGGMLAASVVSDTSHHMTIRSSGEEVWSHTHGMIPRTLEAGITSFWTAGGSTWDIRIEDYLHSAGQWQTIMVLDGLPDDIATG